MLGTNCPIPPNSNWTYKFQAKDQIGTYSYFPSTLMHRAAGGFGGFNIASRSVIPIPYPIPVEEFTLLVGDWYNSSHKVSKQWSYFLQFSGHIIHEVYLFAIRPLMVERKLILISIEICSNAKMCKWKNPIESCCKSLIKFGG